MYTPITSDREAPQNPAPPSSLPRCASVLSTQSQSKRFCQVEINQQPVVVPLEYIIQIPDGGLECMISGVSFPISSYREVQLERGPEQDDTVSVVSLEVPSSMASYTSSFIDSSSCEEPPTGFTIDGVIGGGAVMVTVENQAVNDVTTIPTTSDCNYIKVQEIGSQQQFLSNNIPSACKSSSPSPLMVLGNTPEESGNSILENGSEKVKTVQNVSKVRNLSSDLNQLHHHISSDDQCLPSINQNEVHPTSSSMQLIKSTSHPCNQGAENLLPPEPYELSLKSLPQFAEGLSPRPTNLKGICPMLSQPVDSFEFVKCVISPTAPNCKPNDLCYSRIPHNSPRQLAKQQVISSPAQPAPPPQPLFRPPSDLKPIVVTDVDEYKFGAAGKDRNYHSPSGAMVRYAATNRVKKHRRNPSPKLEALESYVEKVKELQMKHYSHRKAIYVSPSNYIVLDRPCRTRRRSVQDTKPGKRSSSSNSNSSSSKTDIHDRLPTVPPNLPRLEDFASKVSIIQEIHQVAFVHDERRHDDYKSVNAKDDLNIEYDLLQKLPNINDFIQQVTTEKQHTTFYTYDSDSSNVIELNEKAVADELYEKVLNFMELPGLSQLAERMIYHEAQVSKPCRQHHDTSSSSSSRSYDLLKQYHSLQNLPGIEQLEDHYLVSSFSKDSSKYFDGITDTDLEASVSLRRLGITPNKPDTPSSLNTLKDIDDIISTSPFIDLKQADMSDFEFFRVLVNNRWMTARKSDLIVDDSQVWFRSIDGEKYKVQQCVKVPCNYTPDDEIYLCDDKKYKVQYEGIYYTVPGNMIINTTMPNICDIVINGETISIPSANIAEKRNHRPEFDGLTSYVAVKFGKRWRVLHSDLLVPEQDRKYQLNHKSKVYYINPTDVYPILRDADLQLGSNALAESYIVKINGKNYKLSPKSIKVDRYCNEKIQIRLNGKVHSVDLKSLIPNLSYPGHGKRTLTSTTSFSHPEYKHNIYCIDINGTSVNIHGKDIKPHKSKPGYCKMKYKGKILRIRSSRIKLARQNVIDAKSDQLVDFLLPQATSNTNTSQVQSIQVNTSVKKKINHVRYPHFSELLRQIPPIEEANEEEGDCCKIKDQRSTGSGGVLRVKIANKVKRVSKKKGLYIRCSVNSRESVDTIKTLSSKFALDVRPAPTLKVRHESSEHEEKNDHILAPQMTSIEISNLRRSPFHLHKTRSREGSCDTFSNRLVIQCDSVASIPLECDRETDFPVDPH